MIGTVVSHYEIVERLGGGGMGVVYRARDLRLGRSVALKFLSPRLSASPSHKQRLLREARAVAALEHPAVCTIYEVDETEDGQLFLAMAFCEGETLRSRLERGPLHPAQAVDYALQIAAGLAAAHAKGIVHRDVKPANVLITPGGRLKIVDFGVAQQEDQTRLTRPGTVVGTAAYMSPEQLRGEGVDHRTDIWSLGALLYEMVSGRLPFPGPTDREIVRAIFTRDPEPLAAGTRGDRLLADLDALVARALAKRPDERYQSAEQLAAALRALPLDATAPTVIEEATRVEGFTPVPVTAERAAAAPPLPPDERPTEVSPIGATVAQFQVREPLGGGGMGVVYKAEDTRLGRTVALKFLPPALSLDPEAKQRFLQEARAASALEHPNICTIHEVGETPDGRLYLAMPCYDGETLRQRISRGPLPVEEAMEIAEQIARGLAKAHRRGIVHRDVKPANVMVTADGLVKILDFGIATLAGSATSPDTHAGTPAYMSPEQARGEEVDARTDLWSLGVVLFEMLAGRRPYRGEHQQAVRFAHDHEEPPPLADLRPEVPAELARITGRLLARDRGERYADAAAVAADLRALRGETTAETSLRAAPRRRWPQAALAALALLAAAATVLIYLDRRREPEQVQAAFTQLTDLEGSETFPSLSPGGDLFLYTRADGGDLDLFRRKVGGGEAVNLTADSPADDTQPAFSPDGRYIAFRSERDGGGLFVMSAEGTGVRRLTDFGYNPAWSPDGRALLCATEGVSDPGVRRSNSEVWQVDVATGGKRRVVGGDAVQPSWSPDGRRIAYWGLPTGSAQRVIWTAAADGSDPVQVTDDPHVNWNPVWSTDGRLLYFASNRSGTMNIWRVPIDPATGELRGQPQAVTASTSPSALLSLSRDGRQVLYAVDDRRSNLERFRFDPAAARAHGAPQAVTQGARLVRSGEVSPDGRWVVFHSTTPREDLFLVRPDGTGLRQLTDDPYRDRHPRWSPDGRRIAFYSNRSGKYEAWAVSVADGRLEQLSQTTGGSLTDPLWSPDGRRLLCILGSRAAVFLDLARPLPQRLVGQLPPAGPGGVILSPLSWSRNGRLAGVVQQPDEWPLPGLVVHDLGTRRYERVTDRGSDPTWLSGDRLLYVEDGRVRVLDLASRQSQEVLAPPPYSAYRAASADESRGFLYAVREIDQGDVWMLTLE